MLPRVAIAASLVTLTGLAGVGVSAAYAFQPGFGRPKPTRPEKPAEPPPEPVRPSEDDPMEERDPIAGTSTAEFVPAPDQWEEGDPPRKEPAPDVEPGKTYAWRTADGLRYAYTIPESFKKNESFDLVVICHPRGNNFRWGMNNHTSPAVAKEAGRPWSAFRPHDLVVSVDGIWGDERLPDRRAWPATPAAAVRFRDFVLELVRVLPAHRIFIVGYGPADEEAEVGGGGVFSLVFAGNFPSLAEGVVAYGCGLPEDLTDSMRGGTPIVFTHGVKNAMTSFSESMRAVESLKTAGAKRARLRALRSFNDYPNPTRVSEAIDWSLGAGCEKPEDAVAAVERLLTPKRRDEYDYTTSVWYAGAREVLGRVLDEPGDLTGESPFEDEFRPSESVKARAREIIGLMEAEGTRQVEALRPYFPKGTTIADMALDGGPWLGHLIAVRDDFRGVKPVEEFMAEIKFDEAYAQHAEVAGVLIEGWADRSDEENFEAVVTSLPRCYLYEGLPVELPSRMKNWRRKSLAKELDLTPEDLEGFENVANWDEGYRKGVDAYRKVWSGWKFEPLDTKKKTEAAPAAGAPGGDKQ